MVISIDPLPFGSDYSMKDIPIPSRKEYQCKLISQGSKFINNLRWRIWHHLKKNESETKTYLVTPLPSLMRKKPMDSNVATLAL